MGYYTCTTARFFRFSEKGGEPLHINGGIEADGKAVGLM